jgi:hypothetical protein
MEVKSGNPAAWLPYAASAFALVFAVVILSDAVTTILLNGFAAVLSESPSLEWYVMTHLATGATLFAGGMIALLAMNGGSAALLVAGEALAGGALAAIVIFERMSLWALPYLD